MTRVDWERSAADGWWEAPNGTLVRLSDVGAMRVAMCLPSYTLEAVVGGAWTELGAYPEREAARFALTDLADAVGAITPT